MTIFDTLAELPRQTLLPKAVSPKPWVYVGPGTSRDDECLVYQVAAGCSAKRLTRAVVERSYDQLRKAGDITARWFAAEFPETEADGSCNFRMLVALFSHAGVALPGRGRCSHTGRQPRLP